MDGSSEQLAAAHERKMRTYAPLLEALQAYRDEGWQVEIFPWVIGVRGLLDSETIKCCLEFLTLPRQSWKQIIENAAKESVKAFYSLHCVRCAAFKSGPWSSGLRTTRANARASNNSRGIFDTDDPGRSCNRKRRRRSDCDIDETRRRWKQMEKMTQKRS
jgi:hypothetical protein